MRIQDFIQKYEEGRFSGLGFTENPEVYDFLIHSCYMRIKPRTISRHELDFIYDFLIQWTKLTGQDAIDYMQNVMEADEKVINLKNCADITDILTRAKNYEIYMS